MAAERISGWLSVVGVWPADPSRPTGLEKGERGAVLRYLYTYSQFYGLKRLILEHVTV
jgi:hypothetical protein